MKILFNFLFLFLLNNNLTANEITFEKTTLKILSNSFYKMEYVLDINQMKCIQTKDFVQKFTGKIYTNTRTSIDDFGKLIEKEEPNYLIANENNNNFVWIEIKKLNQIQMFYENEELCNSFLDSYNEVK